MPFLTPSQVWGWQKRIRSKPFHYRYNEQLRLSPKRRPSYKSLTSGSFSDTASSYTYTPPFNELEKKVQIKIVITLRVRTTDRYFRKCWGNQLINWFKELQFYSPTFRAPIPSNHDRPGRKSFRTGEHRQNTLKIKFSYFLENPWRGPLFHHSGLIFWFWINYEKRE